VGSEAIHSSIDLLMRNRRLLVIAVVFHKRISQSNLKAEKSIMAYSAKAKGQVIN